MRERNTVVATVHVVRSGYVTSVSIVRTCADSFNRFMNCSLYIQLQYVNVI